MVEKTLTWSSMTGEYESFEFEVLKSESSSSYKSSKLVWSSPFVFQFSDPSATMLRTMGMTKPVLMIYMRMMTLT
jgi:hypothetical protein